MREVPSGRLLSVDTFCSVQWFWQRTAKALIRLRGCASRSGPSLSAFARRHVFVWRGPYMPHFYKQGSIFIIRSIYKVLISGRVGGRGWCLMFKRRRCKYSIIFICCFYHSFYFLQFYITYTMQDCSVLVNRECVKSRIRNTYEPQYQITYPRTCAHSEDSDQPAHLRSLIRNRLCILNSQGCNVSSCGQRRLIRLRRWPGWFEFSDR